jgi:hypothetical protein
MKTKTLKQIISGLAHLYDANFLSTRSKAVSLDIKDTAKNEHEFINNIDFDSHLGEKNAPVTC